MPIKKTLQTKTPVHVWTDQLERVAEDQLRKLAELPILFQHVAVMPDVHAGRGSTIGTVMATKDAIIPAAVGVDIGCGMMAAQTHLQASHLEGKLKNLRQQIEDMVPVGFDQNKEIGGDIRQLGLWEKWDDLNSKVADDDALRRKALAQIGSLGGGNHFIEVCLDQDGGVWIILHSGSRHIGKTLADVHIQNAKDLMKESLTHVPDPDLSYLAQGTEEFKSYIHDLQWAQAYAAQNREEMMARLIRIFSDIFGDSFGVFHTVNCHHNYSAEETHFGKKVWVTRKGAVSAKKGEMGIIPGSMGTSSFIVRGRGNLQSFQSCSHGAGRRMSRNQARRQFSREDLIDQTEGVECRKDNGVLDEIPAAYKDIQDVMRNQSDLVEVVAEIKQVLCVKG